MEYIFLGEIVNTHGIKGEVRIISDFKFKSDVFKIGKNLYIGNYKDKVEITGYRIHKNYDMVTFKGITDINDVLKYKGKKVYIVREEFEFKGILDEDVIDLEVYSNDKKIGIVKDVLKSQAHPILEIISETNKTSYVPFIDEFISNVDLDNKKIYINEIEGLINEN